MKVIAITGETYLVQMVPDELSRLHAGKYGAGYPDKENIGREYAICSAWSRISEMQNRLEELTKTAGKLRALADLLEPICVEIPGARP